MPRFERAAGGPAAWILATGDVLAFVLFAAIGHNTHHETYGAGGVLITAAPFIVAWLIVAPWAGAFSSPLQRTPGDFLGRTALVWLCVWPLALLLRAAVQHRAVPPGFDLVALVANLCFLLIWRTIYLGPRTWARSR